MITGQTILMIPFNIHNLSLRYADLEMENLKTGKCHHYWSIPFIKCLCQPSRHPAPPLFSFFERKNYVQNWHFVVDPWRFGKDKKKENCHILRRREEFLSWRLVMHTSGLFLGLAQHLKQTTKLSSSDYGQKIFAWYYVLGVCIEKNFYLHIRY